jgi:hypothetical protein
MERQEVKKEKKLIPIVIGVVFLIQLALNALLLLDNHNKQREIEKQQALAVSVQKNSTDNQLEKDIEVIKTDIIQNKKDTKLNRISQVLSIGTVVTDKLTIETYITRPEPNNKLAYIGIKPQPSYEEYFVGQGKINLPDREIRGMLQELISEAKEIYDKEIKDLDYMPRFDDYTYTIVHRGYEIATYENGLVKLLGE